MKSFIISTLIVFCIAATMLGGWPTHPLVYIIWTGIAAPVLVLNWRYTLGIALVYLSAMGYFYTFGADERGFEIVAILTLHALPGVAISALYLPLASAEKTLKREQ